MPKSKICHRRSQCSHSTDLTQGCGWRGSSSNRRTALTAGSAKGRLWEVKWHKPNCFTECGGLKCAPSPRHKKSYVKVLNTSTCESDLIWKQGVCRCNWVTTLPYWIRVGLKPNDWCLYTERAGLIQKHAQRRDGHVKMGVEIGMMKLQAKDASNHQKLDRSVKLFTGNIAKMTPWFLSVLSATVKKLISLFLSHSVCSNLLWLL